MLATGNNPLNTYRLSIRISADGFSLSIYNVLDGALLQSKQQNAVAGTPIHVILEEELRCPRLMGYNFQQVELLADTPSTCVPLECFRREEVTALYRLAFPSLSVSNEEIRYQILPSLEVVELYSLDAHIHATVQGLYPDAQFSSYEGKKLEEVFVQSRHSNPGKVTFHAMVLEEGLLICSFLSGKLHFANTYRVDNDADRTYFIMSVWKSLGLEAESDTLHLHNFSSSMVQTMQRFIRRIEICE